MVCLLGHLSLQLISSENYAFHSVLRVLHSFFILAGMAPDITVCVFQGHVVCTSADNSLCGFFKRGIYLFTIKILVITVKTIFTHKISFLKFLCSYLILLICVLLFVFECFFSPNKVM